MANLNSTSSGSDITQATSRRGFVQPTLKPRQSTTSNSSNNDDFHDPKADKAARRRMFQDLPKVNRYFDPNRIELEVPPFFTSPPLPGPVLEQATAPGLAANTRDVAEEKYYGWPAFVKDGELGRTEARIERPTNVSSPGPLTILSAARTDPFRNYPIRMNKGEIWLIDQVNNGEDPTFRTFRERWLPVAIRDAAPFHQFLANVALNISRVRGENLENAVTITHHSLAIRAVNERLSNPDARLSDDVLVSILAFACYSIIKDDEYTNSMHLDGVQKLIDIRGGHDVLDAEHPVLAGLVFGVDMSQALRRDSRPRFPLPNRTISKRQSEYPWNKHEGRSTPLVHRPWKEIFTHWQEDMLLFIFDDLQLVIEQANAMLSAGQTWRVVNFSIFHLYPILFRLLNLRPDHNDICPSSMVVEAARIGIVLFLAEIRRQSGALGVSSIFCLEKLKDHLEERCAKVNWKPYNPLLLWIMFFGLLESLGTVNQEWYTQSLASVAHTMDLFCWDDIVSTVGEFLWMDQAHDHKLKVLQGVMRDVFQGDASA